MANQPWEQIAASSVTDTQSKSIICTADDIVSQIYDHIVSRIAHCVCANGRLSYGMHPIINTSLDEYEIEIKNEICKHIEVSGIEIKNISNVFDVGSPGTIRGTFIIKKEKHICMSSNIASDFNDEIEEKSKDEVEKMLKKAFAEDYGKKEIAYYIIKNFRTSGSINYVSKYRNILSILKSIKEARPYQNMGEAYRASISSGSIHNSISQPELEIALIIYMSMDKDSVGAGVYSGSPYDRYMAKHNIIYDRYMAKHNIMSPKCKENSAGIFKSDLTISTSNEIRGLIDTDAVSMDVINKHYYAKEKTCIDMLDIVDDISNRYLQKAKEGIAESTAKHMHEMNVIMLSMNEKMKELYNMVHSKVDRQELYQREDMMANKLKF